MHKIVILIISLSAVANGKELSTKDIETRGTVAGRRDVVAELEITRAQLAELQQAYVDYRDLKRSLGRSRDFTADDLAKVHGFAKDWWKRQDQILNKDQAARLDQLLIQYNWLADYEGSYRKAIGITFEEQKKLDETAGELAKEVRDKMEQARREYETAMADILTPRQMAKWREARGEMFNFRVRGPHLQTYIILR